MKSIPNFLELNNFKLLLEYFNIDLNKYYRGEFGLKELFLELAKKFNEIPENKI